MKLACSVVLLTLFVVIESSEDRVARAKRGFRTGASDRFSHGFGKRGLSFEDLQKRLGFRHGASDRFSHGFGKRSEDVYSDPSLAIEEMVDILADNPSVRETVLRHLVERDIDGLVNREDLLDERNE